MNAESMGIVKTPVVECPVCGNILNVAKAVSKDTNKPKQNDISVCGYCSAVMVFGRDLKARIITDKEFNFIKTEIPDLYHNLDKVIKLIQEKGGKPTNLFNT